MKGLKLHFLQKDGQLIFGSDFIEVKAVGLSTDYLIANIVLFYLFDSRFVSLNHIDLFVGKNFLPMLFHYYILFYDQIQSRINIWICKQPFTPFS